MRYWNHITTLLVLFVAVFVCAAQQTNSRKMTNQDVIELVSLGLSDDVIIDKIHTSENPDFDTSVSALKALKEAKASDSVIRAMISPKVTQSGPASSVDKAIVVANANPNDPDSAHDFGIYLYGNTRSGKQMLLLEPTVYTSGKSGGMFKSAMTYGIAKMKWKAVVRSAHAGIRTSDPTAVFYFYFEEKGAGLSHASFGTSTPNEFTLLRLEVKGDSRETVVMKANAFGASSGTEDKSAIPFTFTKLKPGVYRVTPNASLKAGEYCFLSAGNAGAYAPGAASANRV